MAAEGGRIDFMFLGPPYLATGSATVQSFICNLSHLIFHATMLTSMSFIEALLKKTDLSTIASNEAHCFHAYRGFIQKTIYDNDGQLFSRDSCVIMVLTRSGTGTCSLSSRSETASSDEQLHRWRQKCKISLPWQGLKLQIHSKRAKAANTQSKG